MIVLLGLPLLLLAGLTCAFARRVGWLDGVVLGFVALAAFWLASAAALSAGGWFGRTGLLVAHLLALVAVLPWCRRRSVRRSAAADLAVPWRRLVREPWLLVVAAEAVVLLVIACSVAPNTFDSMAYHLPRVEQWLQQGAVGPFPAHFAPQLYLPALAEIGMAGFSALGGTVWAVNLVQFIAHLVTMAGVAALARNVGLDGRGQAIAAGVLGLMPLAVSEAVTTQNDYVTTALVVAAYVSASRRGVAGGDRAVWCAVTLSSAGLACATKPTALLFVLPAIVWSISPLLRRPRGGGVVVAASLALGAAVALAANLWWLADNERTFGDPGGPPSALTNEAISPEVVVGNLVRNAGHELGTPLPAVNRGVTTALSAVISTAGGDPDDPRAIYGAARFDVDSQRNEDRPANLVQGVLIGAACLVAVVRRRSRQRLGPLVAAMAVGYLLFAVALKWQVWGGRLLLPLLALGAVVLADWVRRWPGWLGAGLLAALTVQSLPWLLLQTYRPLVGADSVLTTSAEEELFAGRPDLRQPSIDAVESATAVPGRRIGLAPDAFAWEYPLWYLVHRADPTATLGNTEPRYSCPCDPAPFDVVLDLSARE